MKNLLVALVAFTSLTSTFAGNQSLKSIDFYQDKDCSEIVNLDSRDEFIRFAAKEIVTDLGQDICSKVQSIESLESGEMARTDEVSAVQFGKLIESLHNQYTSER